MIHILSRAPGGLRALHVRAIAAALLVAAIATGVQAVA
jgi:hypothetical protein